MLFYVKSCLNRRGDTVNTVNTVINKIYKNTIICHVLLFISVTALCIVLFYLKSH